MSIKRTIALAASSLLLLMGTACSSEQPNVTASAPASSGGGSQAATDVKIPEAVDKKLNVALVTRITTGSWYETYSRAVESEVKALGGSLQIYDSNNDLARMADNVNTAVNAKADILLINNGSAEALDGPVKAALEAKIPVVTYDSHLKSDGIITINQDDHALATNGLKAISDDFKGKANIVVLSVAG